MLCRRRKARGETDLVPLAAVPALTRGTSFDYTFKEDCAAVLKMEESGEADRVRFEFQLDRSGRP